MFQLFKIRAFADYISDTFQFLKLQGKNYFKNYLKYAFVALLLLMVSVTIMGTFYYRVIITSFGLPGDETFDNNFITDNALLLIIGIIVVIVASLYLAILNYSYPVYYLKLLGENPEEKPQLKSIKVMLKEDFGRLLLFGLLSVLVFSIIGFISMGIAIALSFIIIGFFLLMLLMPFFITWYTLTFFFYINQKQPFFEAFVNAWNTIFSNFWNIIGANFCMLIIVYVLSSAVTMIPYMITIFGFFFGIKDAQNVDSFANSEFSVMMLILMIIYCFSILVSMLLNHLLLIQIGLVYYSEREKLEHRTMRQSIDEIGKHD